MKQKARGYLAETAESILRLHADPLPSTSAVHKVRKILTIADKFAYKFYIYDSIDNLSKFV